MPSLKAWVKKGLIVLIKRGRRLKHFRKDNLFKVKNVS